MRACEWERWIRRTFRSGRGEELGSIQDRTVDVVMGEEEERGGVWAGAQDKRRRFMKNGAKRTTLRRLATGHKE